MVVAFHAIATEGGCIVERVGRPGRPKGRGHIKRGPASERHRQVWTLRYGPIPAELVIRRTCATPNCLRLSHLQTRPRGAQPGVPLTRKHPAATHCGRGHTLADAYIDADGRRTSRQCAALNYRLRRERKAAT